jgi:5-methylcytosine-specific restriction endonuclease McrA
MYYGYATDIHISTEGEPYTKHGKGIIIPPDADFWEMSDSQKVEELKHTREAYDQVINIEYVMWFMQNSETPDKGAWAIDKMVKRSELEKALTNPLMPEDHKNFVQESLAIRDAQDQKAKLKRRCQNWLRAMVVERDGFRCRYCGEDVAPKKIHIDHVIPYSLGGYTEYGNLVVACVRCNLKKAGKTLDEAGMVLLPLEGEES